METEKTKRAMYLIDTADVTDPALNLALEEYCFAHLSAGQFHLLFYINEPAVVVGKHQNLFMEADHAYTVEKGIHLMRRISGGGAVYHDPGNLNFSFLAGFKEWNLSRLSELLQPIVHGLNRLGVPAWVNKKNDIVANGRKISGTAQHTNMKMVIHHGTLLFNARLDALRRALNSQLEIPFSKGIASVRSPVANISDFLRHPMTMDEFKKEMIKDIARAFGKIKPFGLDSRQWKTATVLAASKYRSWEWVYGRNPEFTVRHRLGRPYADLHAEISVKNGRISRVDVNPREHADLPAPQYCNICPGDPYDPDRIGKICHGIRPVDLNRIHNKR